ncbi:phosphoenolpyruvate--protein phosphotransferase [Tessaracoccus sp. Z1128]
MADVVSGTGVVEGVVVAPVVWLRSSVPIPEADGALDESERPAEVDRLKAAVEAVAAGYESRAERATGDVAQVLVTTAALARDRGWTRPAVKYVGAGLGAPQAAAKALGEFVAALTALGGLMAERATDLRDIRDRVAAHLLGLREPGLPRPDRPSILLAEDLAPADTADLDPERIVGLVIRLGGPTSHTAIIARQRSLPCVVAAADLASIADGETVLLDGAAGTVSRGVDPAEAMARVAADAERRRLVSGWSGPGRTADGVPVELLANVADGNAAQAAAAGPAQGVGLYRTELGFLSAQHEPGVEEQAATYAAVLDAFGGRKVVVRTLDAGTDKPVPFATMPDEPNPALGVRGNRLSLNQPGLVSRQLDAIARAAQGRSVPPWVMAPMIATVDEAAEFARACRERGLKAGIMVEVPAVALLADAFLATVDFVSIGTNDLTQYVMAADRLAPELAHLTDPWQPAVLRLIQLTCDAGRRAHKPVGVCGEAAADPLLACVLVGLGATSLSMAASAVASVGIALSRVTAEQCAAAGAAAVSAHTAAAAKSAAAAALDLTPG